MGRVEEAVRSAIMRAVERECRARCAPLTSEVRQLGQRLARLEADVASLRGRQVKGIAPRPRFALQPAPEEAGRRSRLTPEGIRKLRAGLGLTQVQLAALLGITGPAVAQWETGASEPRGSNRAALAALRKLGRREVSRMVGAGGDPKPRPPRH